MAITTGIGRKFMEELTLGIHTLAEGDPSSDVIKVALFGPNAVLAPSIDTYSTSGECSGGGYTAGGDTLSADLLVVGATGSSRADGTQFSSPYINPAADITFTIAGVAVRGCMMYNSSQGDRNIFTLDFGETITTDAGIIIPWGIANVLTLNDALIPLIGNTI